MRNVTISISDELACWARVWAAEHDLSVSAMISQALREKMERENSCASAMEEYLSKEPLVISDGKPYATRESLYDR